MIPTHEYRMVQKWGTDTAKNVKFSQGSKILDIKGSSCKGLVESNLVLSLRRNGF